MSDALCDTILGLLEGGKQLSISHITRDLKEMDMEEHRLVITGYLRALRDVGKLAEIEVPPSKTYKLLEESEKGEKDIYSLLQDSLNKIESKERFNVAVFLVTNLFERPIFKEELKLLGITENQIKTSLSNPSGIVKQVPDSEAKGLRKSINKISIPKSDPAYNLDGGNEELALEAFPALVEISRATVDLHGLVPTRLDSYL
ncbi:hypothetical protein J2755_001859 [Methanohalophilus levihalophilus]|uniref:hypothetical protein n=1 Tax=Methanohalophilus levihalophilus TaxID=1431282 RepID=UPI001AE3A045|nr:hypothetical protein [Methanohalophilus levihalophilus]MBP2030911.1 hypothetical protein [Methanohalophilus levihalophilus]